jgi:hypothetical protein
VEVSLRAGVVDEGFGDCRGLREVGSKDPSFQVLEGHLFSVGLRERPLGTVSVDWATRKGSWEEADGGKRKGIRGGIRGIEESFRDSRRSCRREEERERRSVEAAPTS